MTVTYYILLNLMVTLIERNISKHIFATIKTYNIKKKLSSDPPRENAIINGQLLFSSSSISTIPQKIRNGKALLEDTSVRRRGDGCAGTKGPTLTTSRIHHLHTKTKRLWRINSWLCAKWQCIDFFLFDGLIVRGSIRLRGKSGVRLLVFIFSVMENVVYGAFIEISFLYISRLFEWWSQKLVLFRKVK